MISYLEIENKRLSNVTTYGVIGLLITLNAEIINVAKQKLLHCPHLSGKVASFTQNFI